MATFRWMQVDGLAPPNQALQLTCQRLPIARLAYTRPDELDLLEV